MGSLREPRLDHPSNASPGCGVAVGGGPVHPRAAAPGKGAEPSGGAKGLWLRVCVRFCFFVFCGGVKGQPTIHVCLILFFSFFCCCCCFPFVGWGSRTGQPDNPRPVQLKLQCTSFAARQILLEPKALSIVELDVRISPRFWFQQPRCGLDEKVSGLWFIMFSVE